MKNIIKDTRDIQVGKNRVFLRQTIMSPSFRPNQMEELYEYANRGNIPAQLNVILLNQLVIWKKLKEK